MFELIITEVEPNLMFNLLLVNEHEVEMLFVTELRSPFHVYRSRTCYSASTIYVIRCAFLLSASVLSSILPL